MSGRLEASREYEYYLMHNIRRKLKEFIYLELPLIERNESLGNFLRNLRKTLRL